VASCATGMFEGVIYLIVHTHVQSMLEMSWSILSRTPGARTRIEMGLNRTL
jgi:hypothetical protein